MLKQTHLLSIQEGKNPYLSAMGMNLPEYSELCAEVFTGSQRWTDKMPTECTNGNEFAGGSSPDEVVDTSATPLNPYDDPD